VQVSQASIFSCAYFILTCSIASAAATAATLILRLGLLDYHMSRCHGYRVVYCTVYNVKAVHPSIVFRVCLC
jgi:hypothetical protein